MWERETKIKTCPACEGTGLAKGGPIGSESGGLSNKDMEAVTFLAQGICLACRGKGEVRV